MKSLVTFSGGIDSTYVLWKLLTETNDDITAVYFDFSQIGVDMKTEKNAVKIHQLEVLVERLKAVRNFTFIHHIAKNDEIIPQLEHKLLFAIKYAAPYINDGTYDRLVSGASYEDKSQKVVPHLPMTPAYYAEKRLSKIFNRGSYWSPLVDDSWHNHYSRDIALRILPLNILECALLSSCRQPSYDADSIIKGKRCENCSRCFLNDATISMIESGLTSQEIFEWRRVKTYEYGANGLAADTHMWIRTELGVEGAPTKQEIIDYYKNNKFVALRGFTNDGLWKGLIEYIPGINPDEE
jgi:hypothetical protein